MLSRLCQKKINACVSQACLEKELHILKDCDSVLIDTHNFHRLKPAVADLIEKLMIQRPFGLEQGTFWNIKFPGICFDQI